MSAVLGVLGVTVAIALLWTGIKRLDARTPLAAVLSALDVLALILALVQLGWLGLVLFAAVNAAGFLAWGAAGAVFVDSQLSAGAALANADKVELRAVYDQLGRDARLRAMGPRRRAVLVRALAERARRPLEIAVMAPPIGLLWLAHRLDLEALVEAFDTLLRRFDKEAAEAMAVADVLTVAAQQSAGTFDQTLDALLAASA
jgi:hypothetical protein